MKRILSVLLMVGAASLFAQTEASLGTMDGLVAGSAGAVLPNATVVIEAPERGIRRSLVSDSRGAFQAPGLPPGIYSVRVEAPGFRTQTLEGVQVRVGESLSLRIALERAAADAPAAVFRVDATGRMPVVEVGRVQQASSTGQAEIDRLPINRRNYLDFALLTPGAVSTTSVADDTDFRTPQSPQSGVALGGGNGRGTMFTIDGAENYFNTGGVRPSVSQEAVQEFQINRNTFSAEFGGTTGGVINIVTRSGTNDAHGGAFGFLRQRELQARNFFDSRKSPYTRGQYGGFAGGAIRRDKTFYYVNFERLDSHETVFVPIQSDRGAFTRLTPAQTQLTNYLIGTGSPALATLGATMAGLLLPSNFPQSIAMFSANSGNFPFTESSTQGSVRIDQRFSARHSASLRGNITKSYSPNTEFGSLVAYNRGRSIDNFDGGWVLNDTLVLSPRWFNEARVGFAFDSYDVRSSDPNGTQIDIPGYGFFGRPLYLPSKNIERHFQADEMVSWLNGPHQIKFGMQVNPVKDAVVMNSPQTGLFGFGEDVPIGALLGSLAGDPTFPAQLAATMPPAVAATLGTPITALQAYNLGLPSYYFEGFGDPRWTGWTNRYSFFAQDSYHIRPRLLLSLGVRYELEKKVPLFPKDDNNVAPRVGLAWDVLGDGKLAVRAGFGLYYGRIDSNVNYSAQVFAGNQVLALLVPLTGLPGTKNPFTGQPVTSADIFGYASATHILGTRPITAADLTVLGLTPSPTLPLLTKFGVDPHFVNPYSVQSSIEVERAVGQYSISAAYSWRRGEHLLRSHDQNITQAGRNPDGSPIIGFVNPVVLQYNVFESSANSFYSGLTLEVRRRFSTHVSLDAHYTLSRAIDETTDFQTDYEPNNQLNARADRGLSSFHQKHRFVGSAVLESPYHAGAGRGFAKNLLGDFTLSPIVIANSAVPFNILTGFDNVGDRHPNTHRPIGAGRNIGIGPDFFTADLRLTRRVTFRGHERLSAEFMAEAFNLFNRTNFRTVNNTVGAAQLSQLPQPLTAHAGVVTDPLAYTSALNPRQFQFGMRLRF